MRFISTRGQCSPMSLEEALLQGLAPDGGLFMPEEIPRLAAEVLEQLSRAPLHEVADRVMGAYLDDISASARRALVEEALDFEVPLVEIAENLYVLELFHGPTLAFKDVGARFMARLMARAIRRQQRSLTVLVATSGDTGSAVAHAFHGLEGIRVVILYPRGKVSRLQERQITTLTGNVQALAVNGTFDDCQRLVKEAFLDADLSAEMGLTSANSINVARLLPQMIYYFHAVARLPSGSPPPIFSVPSGNFGNLTAGLVARAMGMPCSGFVAATNVNDTVPRYLDSGRYEPRPARATISNAMDVGDPSNFQRMLWMFGGELERMRELVHGSRHSDDETRRTIRRIYRENDYLLDPHTAVGNLGLRARLDSLGGRGCGVVLATAHPAKFAQEIEETLGVEVELPDRLARCLERPSTSIPIQPRLDELASVLRGPL